jgi:gluconolactonase
MATGLLFPEGPAFDLQNQLWFVEQHGAAIACIKDGQIKRTRVGGCPNGIAIDDKQRVWFCDSGENSIRLYDPQSDQTKSICSQLNGEALNMPNDLAFDRRGQLVFTCPGPRLEENRGYICVYTNDNKLYEIYNQLYYPNGLAFSADGKKLFVAETGKKRIWVGDWEEETATWQHTRIFAYTDGIIGPDGMAFDEDGFLYVALFGSGCIRVFDPEGGHYRDLPAGGLNPSNCAFDPTQRCGLVVTETATGSIISLPVFKKGIL